jgi:23S rRNA (adenine2503-C2)-methyltransferase
VDLRSLSLEELAARVAALGEPAYRSRQLFDWLHRRAAASIEEMSDLPRALRDRLQREHALETLGIDLTQRSSDGAIKYRFVAADGKRFEAVYMPEEDRRTLCLSTQVGCAMGCAFCRTARMGLVRHLTAGEIVDQVYRVNAALVAEGLSGPRPLTNVVFMGMGEPLHNWANVRKALDLLQHEAGAHFSRRHLTISTSGIVPVIEEVARQTEVKLAVSLNATTDEQRERLMPVNKRWGLAELMEACRKFPQRQGRRLTFEYVLLKGVNDALEDAHRLARLVKGIEAKVNLIAYNGGAGDAFEAPEPVRVRDFYNRLIAEGVVAITRKSRAQDIAGACGQLVVPPDQGRAFP